MFLFSEKGVAVNRMPNILRIVYSPCHLILSYSFGYLFRT